MRSRPGRRPPPGLRPAAETALSQADNHRDAIGGYDRADDVEGVRDHRIAHAVHLGQHEQQRAPQQPADGRPVVAAMPKARRAGLVTALTAFTEAGEEPVARPSAGEVGW